MCPWLMLLSCCCLSHAPDLLLMTRKRQDATSVGVMRKWLTAQGYDTRVLKPVPQSGCKYPSMPKAAAPAPKAASTAKTPSTQASRPATQKQARA
jgi:hypothetical protein